MQMRGAPLIGATAAYGIALALRADAVDAALERASATLAATRPTAINLSWALDEMRRRCATGRAPSGPPPPTGAPPRSPTRMSRSTARSARTACR